MSKENKKTVEIYEEKAATYLKTTLEHEKLDPEKAKRKKEKLQNFIKSNLEQFEKGSKVFEIGSADGENAKFIKDLGYNVTASDIAEAFINASKSKVENTIKFNVLEDEFKEKYSAVLAWRVFVHFTKEDLEITLNKVYNALENDGIFIFNIMNRETRSCDEEWVDFSNEYHMGAERYYKYFSEDEVNELINKTNFKIDSFHKEGGENKNKWLVYVIKK